MRDTMHAMTIHPDYVVVRASLDLPEGWMPPDLEGRWYNRSDIPAAAVCAERPPATAVPTGRFEVRDYDGAVAEVWEVRPW